jgi:rubredoxin
MSPSKMICPDCGAEMNHHANKIDYGADDSAFVDSVFGGALKEAHTCPECDRTEL